MHILLLGATGRTGKLILEKAVKENHKVTAIVRDPSKLNNHKANIIRGTPYDKETVRTAIKSCDAVVSTLNVSRVNDSPWAKLRSPENIISVSVGNALEAMKENNIKRIIVMSTFGAGETWKKIPLLLKLVVKTSNLKYAFNDHTKQEKLLSESGTDWTVIRLPMLTGEPVEKEVKVKMNNDTKLNKEISRDSVARFILDIIDDRCYYKNFVGISN
jgi:putative NADH-flavin reductase